jgi:tRNA threonylcarbamoyladenosine biosynthesis protein TsaB
VLELDAELAEKGKPYALVGDGIEEMTRVASKTTAECISPLLTDQNAISVAKCAYRAFLSGQSGIDAELKPVYLRLPQAERERLAKLNENK